MFTKISLMYIVRISSVYIEEEQPDNKISFQVIIAKRGKLPGIN